MGAEAGGGQRRPQRREPQAVRLAGFRGVERLRNHGGVERLAVEAERLAQADAGRLAVFDEVAALEGLDEAVHLAERRDAGDRLLAVGPGVGDGAEQLAVDRDRTAAHAGDDAGLLQSQSRKAAQHHVASGAGVLEDAQHFGVELLDLGSLHDGAADALHAGANVIDLPVRVRLGGGDDGGGREKPEQGGADEEGNEEEGDPCGSFHGRISRRIGEGKRGTAGGAARSLGGSRRKGEARGAWLGRGRAACLGRREGGALSTRNLHQMRQTEQGEFAP